MVVKRGLPVVNWFRAPYGRKFQKGLKSPKLLDLSENAHCKSVHTNSTTSVFRSAGGGGVHLALQLCRGARWKERGCLNGVNDMRDCCLFLFFSSPKSTFTVVHTGLLYLTVNSVSDLYNVVLFCYGVLS